MAAAGALIMGAGVVGLMASPATADDHSQGQGQNKSQGKAVGHDKDDNDNKAQGRDQNDKGNQGNNDDKGKPSVPPGQTNHKSYVCKYVGKPGVDERLQTGRNPIWVDNHSLLGHHGPTFVGQEFSDRHGRSVVIVANTKKLSPEPSVSQCPQTRTPSPPPPVTTTTPPVTTTDVCPNITGNQASVPEGFQLVNGQCVQILGEETVVPKPKPEPKPDKKPTVKGVEKKVPKAAPAAAPVAAPTAVAAGVGSTAPTALQSASRALVAGGMLLLMAGAWIGLGRRESGTHEA